MPTYDSTQENKSTGRWEYSLISVLADESIRWLVSRRWEYSLISVLADESIRWLVSSQMRVFTD